MTSAATALRRPAGPVLADLWAGTWVRNAILVFCGAMFTVAGAQFSVHVPGSPVPVTGQTLGVFLAGSMLGANRGAASQLLYLLGGLFLPIYADGPTGTSGTEVIWGATGGYIVGFILAAYAIGYLSERGGDRKVLVAVLCFAFAQLSIYGIGLPWLKIVADSSWIATISDGFTPFIIGDLLKIAIAGAAMPTAWGISRKIRKGDDEREEGSRRE